ncbi:GNAT family N-acetyltransferase [Saccharopolyspora sp. NPDC000359]|uniref:GNAT family N-acetyltransferase n=1 Tax=Saccharopolyspora sp. NPDC000359 TaxID=3154251 RepID=UPI0033269464
MGDRSARRALVGFTNVAWDGGDHAFLLDPKVRPEHQRGGIGTELVRRAAEGAARAGFTWLHVDFEPQLRGFYFAACGFRPTEAGLIALDLTGLGSR